MITHELNDDYEIMQLMKQKKEEDSPERFDAESVHVETKSTTMDTLIKRIENKRIEFDRNFQRSDDVWDNVRQSRLIESMMLRIPLPVFYVDGSNENKWLIIDGLQRINAVKRFVATKELPLTGLELMSEYNGQKFSDLSEKLQGRIREADIVIYQIKDGTPEEARYEIFNRINTGGTPLNPQEIRHALYPGYFQEYLEELARSDEFIRATDSGTQQKRMQDQECVLRFLAFMFLPPENYNDSEMNFFLVKAMKVGNRLSKSKMYEYGTLFLTAMKVSHEIFGTRAFRKYNIKNGSRSTINKALFEAESVNIGKLSNLEQNILIANRNQVVRRMSSLINNDQQFEKSISGSTASVSSIRYRFQKVADMFREIINNHAK